MADNFLGTLTIGQAPRPDVTPILERYVPSDVKRVHRGLLDGLSHSEIADAYAVEAGQPVLVTRLSDGTSVKLSAQKVHSAIQGKLDALEAQGCNIVLVLCTGAFAGLRLKRAFLLEPDRIIPPAVAGLARDRQLGIIVPVASQISSESGKWVALERAPIFAAASPYAATPDAVAAAGVSLANRGAEALLLDCIGFVEAHRQKLVQASGLPVILSNALMAKSSSARWSQDDAVGALRFVVAMTVNRMARPCPRPQWRKNARLGLIMPDSRNATAVSWVALAWLPRAPRLNLVVSEDGWRVPSASHQIGCLQSTLTLGLRS